MSFFDDVGQYTNAQVWDKIVANDLAYIAKTFTTPQSVMKLIPPGFLAEVMKNPANANADIRLIAAVHRMMAKFGPPEKWDEMALKDAGWKYKRHIYMKCNDDFDAVDELPRQVRNWLNNSPYAIDARDALHLYALYLSFESESEHEAVMKTIGRLEHWLTEIRKGNKEALGNRDSLRPVDPQHPVGTISEIYQKAKETIYAT